MSCFFFNGFKAPKPASMMEITTLIVLFAMMLCACTSAGQTAPQQGATVQATHTAPLRGREGLYESCSPKTGAVCLDRLKQMAAAGFTLVLNYDQLYGTAEQQLAYARQAETLRMKVIWAINDPAFWNGLDLSHQYPTFAASCGCSDNLAFIRYFVDLVKHLPATWGYYVGDEVQTGDYIKLKMFTDLLKELDPSHPRLFIAGASSATTVTSNLAPFAHAADVIGADYYPIGSSDMPIAATGDIAHAIQSIADSNGNQPAMVLQSFSWRQYPNESWRCSPFPTCARFPTEQEMHYMLDITFNNSNPVLILWYSYYDIIQSDNPSSHWADLIAATRT